MSTHREYTTVRTRGCIVSFDVVFGGSVSCHVECLGIHSHQRLKTGPTPIIQSRPKSPIATWWHWLTRPEPILPQETEVGKKYIVALESRLRVGPHIGLLLLVMFALRIFGVRLSVGADDLGIPAFVTLLIRMMWLAMLIGFTAVSFQSELEGCAENETLFLRAFVVTLLLGSLLSTLAWFGVYVIANTGSLLEAEKRSSMPSMAGAIILIYFLELCLGCLGVGVTIIWPQESVEECEDVLSSTFNYLLALVICVWLDVSLFITFWLLIVNRNKVNTSGLRLDEFELKSLEWQTRCKRWCNILRCASCGFYGYHVDSGDRNEFAYAEVAEVFASFFTGLKLTPTELIAGLALVKAQQIKDHDNRSKLSISIEDSPVSSSPKSSKSPIQIRPKMQKLPSSFRLSRDESMSQALRELYDVLQYSEAINSWKLHLLQSLLAGKTIRGVSHLMVKSLKHAYHRRKVSGAHSGDNCCAWNHSAFLAMSNLKSEDLVFSNFVSYAHELVAHAVAVDHEKKNVVLAFRGSLALSDFFTDAGIQPQNLHHVGEKWGIPNASKHYAHSGMLHAALKIRAILEETGVLHRLFRMDHDDGYRAPADIGLTEDERKLITKVSLDKLPDCRGYNLIVIGESLGAGIAAIQSVLLKNQFPFLKGYGISTPGCIFDRELADSCSEYFTSLVVGKDLVPRANWQSLANFREEVLDSLERCKVNKNVVLKSLFKKTAADEMLYPPGEFPKNAGTKIINEMRQKIQELNDERVKHVHHVDMFCPGRIIHLVKMQTIKSPRCCGIASRSRRDFEPFWIEDRKNLCHFEISSSMVLHHMPNIVRDALEDCVL